MNKEFDKRLARLNADFLVKNGTPVEKFYCPILFEDRRVPLSRGHIVNKAFPDSDRSWTVQRTDVDNFFGTYFEADFLDIVYKEGRWSPFDCLSDPELIRKYKPKIEIGETLVPYYLANGHARPEYTIAHCTGPVNNVQLTLKISRAEAAAHAGKICNITVEKDLILPALVSVMKAAHLTLFHRLGYSYALSSGGRFLGKDVLGDFFLQNRHGRKDQILAAARSHFAEFKNMMRPVTGTLQTTWFVCVLAQMETSGRLLFLCGLRNWSMQFSFLF